MLGGGGGAGGAGDRRPQHPRDDIPCMGAGRGGLRNLDVPQHFLHLQNAAALHLRHSHADSGAPRRPLHGGHAAQEGICGVWAVALQPQPGPFQYQGARDYHGDG